MTHASHYALRERAAIAGLASLADVEVLEMFLGRIGFEDAAAELAKALMDRFGSLHAVLAAGVEELKPLIGLSAAMDLKLLHETTTRLLAAPLRDRPLLTCWSAVNAYLRHDMQTQSRELFRVLFLDKKNCLMVDEVMGEGSTSHAPVYPREIIRRALELRASNLILVHNHPSGDPTPSAADISMTKQVKAAAETMEIGVIDHIIVGLERNASLAQLGLM